MDELMCFVLMPFKKELEAVYSEISRAVTRIQATSDSSLRWIAIRADDITKNGNILKTIVENICKADIVIADMTEMNPNVFYELGVAHAWYKHTIMISNSIDCVPFDLRPYRVIEYDMDDFGVFRSKLNDAMQTTLKEKPSNPPVDYCPEGFGLLDKEAADLREKLSLIGIKDLYFTSSDTLDLTLDEARTRYQFMGVSTQFVTAIKYFRPKIASKTECKFQFLLLNPFLENKGTQVHAKRERKSVESLSGMIRSNSMLLDDIKKNNKIDIEIRYYDHTPDFRLVILNDSRCYVGYYGCEDLQGVELPQLAVIKTNLSIFAAFNALWEQRWHLAHPIDGI